MPRDKKDCSEFNGHSVRSVLPPIHLPQVKSLHYKRDIWANFLALAESLSRETSGYFKSVYQSSRESQVTEMCHKKTPKTQNCQPSNFWKPQGSRPPVQTSQQCNHRRRFINRHTSRSQDHLSLKTEEQRTPKFCPKISWWNNSAPLWEQNASYSSVYATMLLPFTRRFTNQPSLLLSPVFGPLKSSVSQSRYPDIIHLATFSA